MKAADINTKEGRSGNGCCCIRAALTVVSSALKPAEILTADIAMLLLGVETL